MSRQVYRDSDATSDEVFRGRAARFAEECERFERQFGISIDAELDGIVSSRKLAQIRSGEIDVIPALRRNDLWAVLISLHVDLRYVLWGRR